MDSGGGRGGEGQTFAVEEKDDVFAEGFAGGAVEGEDLDDLICELGGWGLAWAWAWVVSEDHVLLVQNKLFKMVSVLFFGPLMYSFLPRLE